MRHDRSEIFEKPLWSAIASLCVPSLLSILVMMFYNLTDMYFVAMMDDYVQVGAVSLVSPVFGLLTSLSTMFGNGGCTVLAQELGRGDKRAVQVSSSLCIWAAAVCGALLGVLGLVFNSPLLKFLGANEELWGPTKEYLLIMLAGAPVITLSYTLGSLIRGEGAVQAGLIGNLAGTLVNIILDPIFILALRMGVAGAALATVIANIVAMSVYIFCKLRLKLLMSFDPRLCKGELRKLGRVMALGFPNATSGVLSSAAGTFSNQLLVGYGTGAVAAMGAAGKCTMIVSMTQMGIAMGVQPLMAYRFGGQNWEKLQETVKKLLILTLSVGLFTGLAGLIGSRWLVRIFINDESVLALGQRMVLLQLIAVPFLGIFYVATNFLQATGDALGAAVSSFLRQGILLIPLLHIMNWLLKLDGLPLSHTVADFLSILISAAIALHHAKKLGVFNSSSSQV